MTASKHKVPIMNFPADLSPETAAWIQAQIAISKARTVATLHAEIDKVDDWTNGVFVALNDVLQPLLRELPALGQQLAPAWRRTAERFDALQTGGAVPDRENDESLEVLEARKMLFRICASLDLWPQPARARPVRVVPSKRRA